MSARSKMDYERNILQIWGCSLMCICEHINVVSTTKAKNIDGGI